MNNILIINVFKIIQAARLTLDSLIISEMSRILQLLYFRIIILMRLPYGL